MRIKPKFSANAELIEAIRSGGIKREQAIAHIFGLPKLRNMIVKFITNRGGQYYEAEEIFSQAVSEFDVKIRRGKLDLQTDVAGYIFGTCRFLWFGKKKKTDRLVEMKDHLKARHLQESKNNWEDRADSEWKEAIDKAVHLLDTLPQRPKKVLQLWMLNYPMEEIAELTGLASAQAARVCKYRALKKLSRQFRNTG